MSPNTDHARQFSISYPAHSHVFNSSTYSTTGAPNAALHAWTRTTHMYITSCTCQVKGTSQSKGILEYGGVLILQFDELASVMMTLHI